MTLLPCSVYILTFIITDAIALDRLYATSIIRYSKVVKFFCTNFFCAFSNFLIENIQTTSINQLLNDVFTKLDAFLLTSFWLFLLTDRLWNPVDCYSNGIIGISQKKKIEKDSEANLCQIKWYISDSGLATRTARRFASGIKIIKNFHNVQKESWKDC